jgi:hypothetical protein
MGSDRDLPARCAALRGSWPREDQILPEPCRIDALELEGEHKPEPARRSVTLDEVADFLPGAFKPGGTSVVRVQLAADEVSGIGRQRTNYSCAPKIGPNKETTWP